ncbi:uncharacterized protein DFL_008832 [Arthrobotrys flagrans]|uniref:AAA+ ATPase domain-containing protein n=1 Tax=Arthrobotrys flagrans TaxID=97331 RepID=A0A436ZPY7_ARTFL|nr:hypothetical protein DFL_008832 [Arthrobotrys flagrans]
MNQIQSLPASNSNDLRYDRDTVPRSSTPLTMLETFIPTASTDFMFEIFDFLSLASYNWIFRLTTVTFAIISSTTYIWSRILYYLSLYYEASITIDYDDPIHTHVMTWLSVNVTTRRLQARTAKASGSTEDQNRVMEYNALAKVGKFHLIEWQKFTKPDFEPHIGEHIFYFRGRRFWITRNMDENVMQDDLSGKQFSVNKSEYIRISCWGQSADPIKEFLQESKSVYLTQECSKTRIFRPKEITWNPRWYCAATRATRPISTISLDESTKKALLRDVNEFLNPKAPRWYANRGIPYRRGYLLHGPPGTGKTSLSFALGGLFGLPIYCLSLVDKGMTEDRLLACFGALPSRCIVLLEDIDTVDISRRRDGSAGGDKSRGEHQTQMTLSGLLNAIDGVASHEGRILIMTTNHPEVLDPALVRKGRIDLEVPFGLATKEQIVNLFTIMYSHDYDDEERENEIAREKLIAAALRFGDLLDADTFSPAEITEFLMVRKDYYWKALRDVTQWKEEVLTKREEAAKRFKESMDKQD